MIRNESDRLPAAVTHCYFNSEYVLRLRQSLISGSPSRSMYIAYRDFLILAIEFYNGYRPMVLVNLTNDQIRTATIQEVDGPEPLNQRVYASMLVAWHNTSKSSGAAGISVPPMIFRELRQFQLLSERIFGPRSPQEGVFLTQFGEPITAVSVINECIQRTYTASGTQTKYPQHVTCTATRKLVSKRCACGCATVPQRRTSRSEL